MGLIGSWGRHLAHGRTIVLTIAVILVALGVTAFATVDTVEAQGADETTLIYVSANRLMEYDGKTGVFTTLEYAEEGAPIMPSRALSGTAISWTVRSMSAPYVTYVSETLSEPGQATLHQLTGDLYTFPRVSPDGTRLLYIMEEPDPYGGLTNNLYVRDVMNGTILFSIADVDSADWAPDGNRIVFSSYPRARIDPDLVTMYVYDIATATETRLPAVRIAAIGEINTYSPRWAPSGEWIAYQRHDSDSVSIMITDPTGSSTQEMGTIPWERAGQGLEWLRMPDGTERLFTDYRELGGSPYLILEVPSPDIASPSARILHGSLSSQAQPDFPDIDPEHPAYHPIRDLASLRVIRGFDDGSFGADKPVTRQQFAKMIVKTIGLTVTGTEDVPFTDVAGGLDEYDLLYPDKYVAVCAAAEITKGTNDPTKFNPYGNITRAQLTTMVARAAGLPEPPGDYEPPFGDFSPDHYQWARRAAHAGLLEGLGAEAGFDFWANATRGEVCVLLSNLLHR